MPLVGVSKLQHLCVALLIEFRDCLGTSLSSSVIMIVRAEYHQMISSLTRQYLPAEDIGDTPIELLQPILLRCNAEQLAGIEDGTRLRLLLHLFTNNRFSNN